MGSNDHARTRGPARLRWAAVIGATVISTVLSSCGFVNSGDDSEAGGSGKLTVFSNTEQAAGLESLYAAFQKESGITVDATSANTDELNQRLRVQLTSGTAADVFRVSPGFSSPVAVGVLGKNGLLADISGQDWTGKLPPEVQTLAKAGDKTMAFPVARNAIVMAYNTKVFSDHGVAVPKTWSELLAAGATLKKAGVTPIAAALQGGITLQFWIYALAATLVYAENPDIESEMAAGKTSFAKNPGWRQVFEKFLELRDAGYFSEGALGVPADQGMQAVAAGKAAMILTVTPALPQLRKYAESDESIGVFALPATDSAADTHMPIAPDFLAVNAKAANADAARDFLEFLAKPENVAEYATKMSVLPGLAVDTKAKNKGLENIQPLIDGGKTTPYANYLWPNGDVQQTLLQSGQQLYSKSITLDELLSQLDTQYAKGTP